MDRTLTLLRLIASISSLAAALIVIGVAAVLATPKPPSEASGVPSWKEATDRAQKYALALMIGGVFFLTWAFVFVSAIVFR